eukprot:2132455-Pyramimonas_sp.AAC.1
MSCRPSALACRGRQCGTLHWKRGRSLATLRGQPARDCPRHRARCLPRVPVDPTPAGQTRESPSGGQNLKDACN